MLRTVGLQGVSIASTIALVIVCGIALKQSGELAALKNAISPPAYAAILNR